MSTPIDIKRDITLERTLSYRLHVLHKLSDQTSAAAYLADAGLPMSEGRCLAAIGAFGASAPMSVNDLAQHANLEKTQASRAAQALVECGLITKTASTSDGRGVVLNLTREGRKAWQRVAKVIVQRNEAMVSDLSAAEREQFGALLDRLIATAQAQA